MIALRCQLDMYMSSLSTFLRRLNRAGSLPHSTPQARRKTSLFSHWTVVYNLAVYRLSLFSHSNEEHRMSLRLAFVQRTVVCLMALGLGYTAPAFANPHNYPEFAQHQVDLAIPIFFTGVERVKQDLDMGHTQMLVDVRSREEYDAGHLP